MYLNAASGAEDPVERNMLTSERICNSGTPNGWFIMENPIKMDDLGGKPTIFGSTHIGSSGKISKNIEGFSDDPNIFLDFVGKDSHERSATLCLSLLLLFFGGWTSVYIQLVSMEWNEEALDSRNG